MYHATFEQCETLLRILEEKLQEPFQFFYINISNNTFSAGKGRIQLRNKHSEDAKGIPFHTTWQTPLDLAITLNAMLAVLEYKDGFTAQQKLIS